MTTKELIRQGVGISQIRDFKNAKTEFNNWCGEIRKMAVACQMSPEALQELCVKMHFIENEYSITDSMANLRKAIENICRALALDDVNPPNELSEHEALLIVERILTNFYLHVKAMYHDKPHGKGTIQEASLKEITIGNEYDLQRILYSLLVPIFPDIRTEVNGDNGYGGIRTDIYLSRYQVAIELKCTRKSMTEKDLIDQLGADGFHYTAKTLYMFVYDKDSIIKNVTAFENAFKRECPTEGKKVRAIVIQPVWL